LLAKIQILSVELSGHKILQTIPTTGQIQGGFNASSWLRPAAPILFDIDIFVREIIWAIKQWCWSCPEAGGYPRRNFFTL